VQIIQCSKAEFEIQKFISATGELKSCTRTCKINLPRIHPKCGYLKTKTNVNFVEMYRKAIVIKLIKIFPPTFLMFVGHFISSIE
jgi:hypothetical protein